MGKIFNLIFRKFLIFNVIFFLIALSYSYYFTIVRLDINQGGLYDAKSLQAYVLGTHITPHQYRVLSAWIVKWILTKTSLPNLFPKYISLIQLFDYIDFICLFFLIVAFRHYISLFLQSKIKNTIFSLILCYILPFHFLFASPYVWFPYDISSLLFFTIGLILLYKQKWPMYYALFIVATYNRETTFLLILIYLLTSLGKNKIKVIALHCFLQSAIWIAIKLSLYRLYENNPGFGTHESCIAYNLKLFTIPHLYPFLVSKFLAICGYMGIPVIFFFRLIQNDFLKKALFAVPIFFIVVMWVAPIHELRDFGEVILLILPASIIIIDKLLSNSNSSQASNS